MWKLIEEELPPAYQTVLLSTGEAMWVGYLEVWVKDGKDQHIWWLRNPKLDFGEDEVVSLVPKYWQRPIQED
jgi:hypothetical protein